MREHEEITKCNGCHQYLCSCKPFEKVTADRLERMEQKLDSLREILIHASPNMTTLYNVSRPAKGPITDT